MECTVFWVEKIASLKTQKKTGQCKHFNSAETHGIYKGFLQDETIKISRGRLGVLEYPVKKFVLPSPPRNWQVKVILRDLSEARLSVV